MFFLDIIKTSGGKILFSIILGLGLASIFYKTATYKNNIKFDAPIISNMDGNIFKYGEKCYVHNSNITKCNDTFKKIVDFEDAPHTGILSFLFL
jgi:hypothetical protein